MPGAPGVHCERNSEAELLDEPSVSGISTGHPFWTVEYLYTKGIPPAGSMLAAHTLSASPDFECGHKDPRT